MYLHYCETHPYSCEDLCVCQGLIFDVDCNNVFDDNDITLATYIMNNQTIATYLTLNMSSE